jgi:inhibitor of cysteine peptidase
MSNIRNRITALMIFLVISAMPVTVCAAPIETGCMKVIDENYNGKTILITQGDNFCIRLKENPSTGYSWQLSLNKGLKVVSSNYYSSIPSNSVPSNSVPSNSVQRFIVGAAGIHSWKIKAVARGGQQIKGIYRRSWEKETGKEQTFKLNIKVF